MLYSIMLQMNVYRMKLEYCYLDVEYDTNLRRRFTRLSAIDAYTGNFESILAGQAIVVEIHNKNANTTK